MRGQIETGARFGRLTVLLHIGGRNAEYVCVCDCGETKVVLGFRMKSGNTSSCGCFRREIPVMRSMDLTGRVYGRLTVTGLSHRVSRKGSGRKYIYWTCECSCGNPFVAEGNNLRLGVTKSCGCLMRENCAKVGKSCTKHGMANTRTYKCWTAMKARCLNPKTQEYSNYGGRGISVCDRWINSFENFFADMGEMPKGMSIERKDVNGNYCPENCKWATHEEQQNNKTNHRFVTFKGETKNLSQWAKSLGVKYTTLRVRLDRGWSVEDAMLGKRANG